MHATHTPPFVSQREIRAAAQCFGRAAGPWLAARERQRAAIALTEQAWLLKEAGGAVSSPAVIDGLLGTIGAAFVRFGRRLQAMAGTPVVGTQS
jgi:hypothetical protein